MNKENFMQTTINLAKKNVANGGWPFAAIIVKNKEIIAEGLNSVHLSNDPSDHAEIAAIRVASSKLNTSNLSDCEMYVVGMPCPMCLSCIVLSKIKKIYYSVDVKTKDKALTKLPLTEDLYKLISSNFAEDVIEFEHLEDFSEKGELVFKNWNNI